MVKAALKKDESLVFYILNFIFSGFIFGMEKVHCQRKIFQIIQSNPIPKPLRLQTLRKFLIPPAFICGYPKFRTRIGFSIVMPEYPQVVKYLTWKPHQKIEETRDFILNILKRAQSNPKFPYTITRKKINNCWECLK